MLHIGGYRKITFSLALIIGLFIPIWLYFIVPQLTLLPSDFRYDAELHSFDNLYDQQKQEFLGEVESRTLFSYETVRTTNKISEIRNTFDVRKPTGEKIFSVSRLYGINRATRAHTPKFGDKDRNGFLFAPKNLNGQDFIYWHINYDQPLLMKFRGAETVLGLTVYHYTTEFLADQTKNLTYLPDVGTTFGINLDVKLELWIEPITGRMIRYNDNAIGYYYNLITGERTRPWNSFNNDFTFQSLSKQVDMAKKEMQQDFWINKGIPFIMVLLIILLIIISISNLLPAYGNFSVIIPLFTFVVSATTTGIGWNFAKRYIDSRGAVRFEIESQTIKNAITDRLDLYAAAIRGAKGLFVSSNEVSRKEWSEYAATINLDRYYPGAQGLGYATFIRPEELTKHIKKIREEGLSDYKIFPEGKRGLYSPIIYIEPLNPTNQKLFGFDMFQEPSYQEAMAVARDNNEITISGKITSTQDTGANTQPEFLMYAPIYKNGAITDSTQTKQQNILGYVFMPFRANDLMRRVVGDALYDIDYEIFDGPIIHTTSLLYDSDTTPHSSIPNYKVRFARTDTISLYNRLWTIHFFTKPGYALSSTEENFPLYILLAGSSLGLLVSLILYFLLNSRHRAINLAKKMTEELSYSKNELSEYLNSMSTFTAKLDTRGNFILFNTTVLKASGLSAGQIYRSNFIDGPWWSASPSARSNAAAMFKKALVEKKRITFNEMVKFGNQTFYLNINLVPILNKDNEIRYIIAEGSDITNIKIAEEKLKKRTVELERLTNVMVGRELKMVELKNKLHGKLDKTNNFLKNKNRQ